MWWVLCCRSQNNMGRKEHDSFSAIKQAADASRLYVMEGHTQFAMVSAQSQACHTHSKQPLLACPS